MTMWNIVKLYSNRTSFKCVRFCKWNNANFSISYSTENDYFIHPKQGWVQTWRSFNLPRNILTKVCLSFLYVSYRYHGIFRPLRPRMAKSTLVVIVSGIWMISVLAALPAPMFTRVSSGKCGGEVVQHVCFEYWYDVQALKVYTVLITLVEFLLPMWIMAFIYFSIALKLWSHRTPPGNVTERHREITFVRKQKTIPMLVTLVVAFFISWAPYYGYNLAFTFFQGQLERNFEYRYSMLYAVEGIAMFNSVISTIIYFIMSPVFRKEISAAYARFFTECPPKLKRTKAISNKSTGSHSSNVLKSNNIRKPTVDTFDTKI